MGVDVAATIQIKSRPAGGLRMRNIFELTVVAMSATVLTIGGLSAQGVPSAQVLRMVIQSHPNAGQNCLDVPSAQFIVGMRLQTFDCNKQSDQTFEYDQDRQRLVIGHLCVESFGGGDAADGVGLGVCNGAPNQQWRMGAIGDYYQIVGVNDRCLEIRPGTTGNGAPLHIQNCQPGSAGQLWALIEAPNPQAACTHVAVRFFADLCGNCTKPPFDIEVLRTASREWVTQYVDGNGHPGTSNWRSISESNSILMFYDKDRDMYVRIDLFGRKTYFRKGNTRDWIPVSNIIRSDC
jgi:Ricin-type beta-trefoil lectin domain